MSEPFSKDNFREPAASELAGEPLSGEDRKFFEEKAEWAKATIKQAHEEVGKKIYGQDEVIDLVLADMVAGGNLLAEGVPGLAKTLLVSTLAQVMGLDFQRIQCTPDLMPPDILGIEVRDEKNELKFVKGPVFTQFLMADEINRTGPRTQAALLQAMQEKQVTVSGQTHLLKRPFITMATQNPLEQDGTYPLPEAQLDRFHIKVPFNYPDESAERRIILETTTTSMERVRELFNRSAEGDLTAPDAIRQKQDVKAILGKNDLILMQELSRRLPLPEKVVKAILDVVRDARPTEDSSDFIRKNVKWGPGPRASQAFALVAKAQALMRGELAPNVDDIRALMGPVLEHRMQLDFRAKRDETDFPKILEHLSRKL